MNKMRLLTISVITLLVLNAVSLFFLFQDHLEKKNERHHPPEEGPAKFIISELKLDDEQQKKFEILKEEHQGQMKAIHEEDKKLHDELFSLLKTDQPDLAKKDSIVSHVGQLEQKMAGLTFEHFQKLRSICGEDQKKRFDNIIDEVTRMMGRQGPPPPRR